MNTQKLFILVTLTVVLAVLIFIFGRLLSNLSNKTGKQVLESGLTQVLHTCFTYLSLAILFQHGLKIVFQSTEILFSVSISSAILIFKSVSIFTGISFIWFLILYSVVILFNRIIMPQMNLKMAIENNNYSYIIIHDSLLISLSLALLPIYSSLLPLFLPDYINQIIY